MANFVVKKTKHRVIARQRTRPHLPQEKIYIDTIYTMPDNISPALLLKTKH